MSRSKFAVLAAVFFVAACLLSCSENKKDKTTLQIICRNGKTKTVKVELAITPQEQQTGFMFRKDIPDGTGMLFIFEKEQLLAFWMKNTPTPLSIAYIDSNGIIKDIFDMQPFSLETIASTTKARYALEVPQGWFAKEGIEVGDSLKITDKIK
ncbi:MAG: DUF192 domain-containing protein [Spirochaetaceae bacterium]|nr:DUF192 domain-containing protein [Spirochaetaceae bacterium]